MCRRGERVRPERRKVATRLLVDDSSPSQKSYLFEIVDNPVGVKAIVQCDWHAAEGPYGDIMAAIALSHWPGESATSAARMAADL